MESHDVIRIYQTREKGVIIANESRRVLYVQAENYLYETPGDKPRKRLAKIRSRAVGSENHVKREANGSEVYQPGERIIIESIGHDVGVIDEVGSEIVAVRTVPRISYQREVERYNAAVNDREAKARQIAAEFGARMHQLRTEERARIEALPRPTFNLEALLGKK